MTAKMLALTFGYNFHNRIIQLSTRCNIRAWPHFRKEREKKEMARWRGHFVPVNWLIGVNSLVSTCWRSMFRMLSFLWFCWLSCTWKVRPRDYGFLERLRHFCRRRLKEKTVKDDYPSPLISNVFAAIVSVFKAVATLWNV